MSERTPPATLYNVYSTGYKVLSEWIYSYSNNESTISIRFLQHTCKKITVR